MPPPRDCLKLSRDPGLEWNRAGGGAGLTCSCWAWSLVSGATRHHHAPPRSVVAGWVGSDPTEGRTPMADGQWWADRLGNRQAEGGSAVASWSFYSPEAESSGEMFRPWGAARLQRSSRRRRIPAPLPKEDGRVLAYRHVPPCGQGSINPAGSGAHGAADRPRPSLRPAHGAAMGGDWRLEAEDTGGGGWSAALPPRRRRRAGMGFLQPCAGSGRRRRRRGRRPPPWGDGKAGRWVGRQ